ncbi:MAG TPA: carbamoyltransferase N-terminal domain-containing protein, partial [Bryobacteraceae bacterium]|nr:carbamoyltransferase N-terminal domain-containing protein [Bryobacteraceae bacterium]
MFLLHQSTHRMLIRYNSRVGHLYVPNLKARLPNEAGGYFAVTNSAGFRSDFEFIPARGPRPRILMFGDSFTAGDDVPNELRYSDFLARQLDCEVYNFGVSGSGTDQHLLIRREFARGIEADLIVVCVQIDSMKRIQLSHRESVDRITGRRVLVPKPYFELVDGKLDLRQVPVPLERPEAGERNPELNGSSGVASKLLKWYRESESGDIFRRALSGKLESARSAIFRASGMQPYPDFDSPDTPGWRLMSAILREFVEDVRPLPILIVPIPTHEYYLHGIKPIYQKFFESLEDPSRGVHVADVSNPLISLPFEIRQSLGFRFGGHFTPFANEKVADIMAAHIRERNLLPQGPGASVPRPAPVTHKPVRRPGSKYILGLSCFYHNSAAALVRDGEIVAAAEEERFSRLKNDRRFPTHAVNYVLEEAGVNPPDLDAVVYYDNASLTFERILQSQFVLGAHARKAWERAMPSWVRYKLHLPQLIRDNLHYDGPVFQEIHHRSHAASAFYPSPFERAAILTVDGVGEWATASIGAGSGSEVRLLHEMRFPHSIGLLYSAFTQFTGFKVNSGEYKMMGLAPYGEPKYVDQILGHL